MRRFPNQITLIDDTLEKLKTQLAREELEQQKAGVVFSNEMSPAKFLQKALDIEVAQ